MPKMPPRQRRGCSPKRTARADRPSWADGETTWCSVVESGAQSQAMTEPAMSRLLASRPMWVSASHGSWARKERSREATQEHAGADHPQAAGGRPAAGQGQTIPEVAKALEVSERSMARETSLMPADESVAVGWKERRLMPLEVRGTTAGSVQQLAS